MHGGPSRRGNIIIAHAFALSCPGPTPERRACRDQTDIKHRSTSGRFHKLIGCELRAASNDSQTCVICNIQLYNAYKIRFPNPIIIKFIFAISFGLQRLASISVTSGSPAAPTPTPLLFCTRVRPTYHTDTTHSAVAAPDDGGRLRLCVIGST